MDINALYDREMAYYNARSIVVYIPLTNDELNASVQIRKTDLGVTTTITAPYSPLATETIDEIVVLNKPQGVPVEYTGTFTAADTATLTPTPVLVVGQKVKIGNNTYQVATVTGSVVKFDKAVSELLVFVAQAIAPDVAYQWQVLNGELWSNIPGATARTYEPLPSDLGKQLRVIVTYTDGQGVVGQSSVASTATLTPGQQYAISPVFPEIARVELDVQRTYPANSINTLTIEIESL